MRTIIGVGILLIAALSASARAADGAPARGADALSTGKRSMGFADVLGVKSLDAPAVSPDGQTMVYVVNALDWQTNKTTGDLWRVDVRKGVATSRQLTSTKDKNEVGPRWSRDGKFFVFASNRDAPAQASDRNQLYLMRADGGDAVRLTQSESGIDDYAFSADGRWLAYAAGKGDDRQIWLLPAQDPAAAPVQLTRHASAVGAWKFSPDGRVIYFIAPEKADAANAQRVTRGFTVRVRNEQRAPDTLWAVDLATRQERLLVSSPDYSVSAVTLSKDSKWLGFRGISNERYKRFINEAAQFADLYLLELATGKIERLTDNGNISESELSFSPDSRSIAFSAADDFTYERNARVYLRAVTGGVWRKLGGNLDGDVSVGFWAANGRTIFFNEGLGATSQVFALATDTGTVTALTQVQGVARASFNDDTGTLLLTYSDPTSPTDYYTAPLRAIGNKPSWVRLTDSNPDVRDLALGETSVVSWTSVDGERVEGILVKPVGYRAGQRYPLIVQIHGGPASASQLSFTATYVHNPHVYAGAGYAVLLPNYRGSSNYGEKFRLAIVGDYFGKSFPDIMTGVDSLVAGGIVDESRMGVMGWSSGGTWSNWINTHTTRFKAVSAGAGVANWLSMYAQSDLQGPREFYHRGKPYDHIEHYWDTSSLKYIKDAKTPELLHVVDGDPRVPRPQSEEMYMGLRKLGVPAELFVYPGTTHNIADARNQMTKMVIEFNWFEKWIRGREKWFDWEELLATLEAGSPAASAR